MYTSTHHLCQFCSCSPKSLQFCSKWHHFQLNYCIVTIFPHNFPKNMHSTFKPWECWRSSIDFQHLEWNECHQYMRATWYCRVIPLGRWWTWNPITSRPQMLPSNSSTVRCWIAPHHSLHVTHKQRYRSSTAPEWVCACDPQATSNSNSEGPGREVWSTQPRTLSSGLRDLWMERSSPEISLFL